MVPLLSWYTAEFDDKDDRVQGRNCLEIWDPLDLLREIAVISEVENTQHIFSTKRVGFQNPTSLDHESCWRSQKKRWFFKSWSHYDMI